MLRTMSQGFKTLIRVYACIRRMFYSPIHTSYTFNILMGNDGNERAKTLARWDVLPFPMLCPSPRSRQSRQWTESPQPRKKTTSQEHLCSHEAVLRHCSAKVQCEMWGYRFPRQRISAPWFSFRACRTFETISSACSSVRVWFSSRMVREKATDFLPWTMWVPV